LHKLADNLQLCVRVASQVFPPVLVEPTYDPHAATLG
jgi:hypothetical protein